MFRVLVTATVAVLAGTPALAQLQLTDNEPKPGRIAEGKTNTWSFEVKEDGAKIRLAVTSDIATLSVGVERNTVKGNIRVECAAGNGKGKAHYNSWVQAGTDGSLELVTTKPMPMGKYTIVVVGADKNQTGPYKITLLEPKLVSTGGPRVQPVPAANEVTKLQKDVEVLQKQMELLNAKVDRLTDLLLKRK